MHRGGLALRLEMALLAQTWFRMVTLHVDEELAGVASQTVLLARRSIGHIEHEADVPAEEIRVEHEAL